MARPAEHNVFLSQAAHEKLKELQKDLLDEGIPPGARLKDIASALILYASPQQAAGMLSAYSRYISAHNLNEEPEGA